MKGFREQELEFIPPSLGMQKLTRHLLRRLFGCKIAFKFRGINDNTSYSITGLISHCMDSEMPEENNIWSRQYLGQVFRKRVRSKECEILEGHMMPDHLHMLISIPPQYSTVQILGFIKGKTGIHMARNYMGHQRNFAG